jgi:5-methylcytosine-specific restriction endonuclease McrA
VNRPCLDCGAVTRNGSRCWRCQSQRDDARNRTPAQQARLAITREQRHRVYARDGWRCVDCGRTDDLTLEHVTPLAVRVKASYSDKELATRCRRCNSKRAAAGRRAPPRPMQPTVSRG